MRLPGRAAAAIDCLHPILDGQPVETVLRDWARQNRYAGSKDRSAIRDILYDVLRRKDECEYTGGGPTPRALVLGWTRLQGFQVEEVFGADPFGPTELTVEELSVVAPKNGPVWNMPDWISSRLLEDHGDTAMSIAKALCARASLDLRVNIQKMTRTEAQAALTAEGFEVEQTEAATGLRVIGPKRAISQSKLFQSGAIELQDTHSQSVCAEIPVQQGQTILDYCAGGGGKTLALAAKEPNARFLAWDISSKRLRDLPERAKRAGSDIEILNDDPFNGAQSFDAIVLDVPCSGSGSWRRDPQGKWRLTKDRLEELQHIQSTLLDRAAPHVAHAGCVTYVTCSVFEAENQNQIERFLATNPHWAVENQRAWLPNTEGDGFFLCILRKI